MSRKQGTVIFHFIILLVQVSILFFVAANVNVLQLTSDSESSSLKEKSTFILSLILMIGIDILWTIIEIGPLKNQQFPQEWLYNNIIAVLFLFCIATYMNKSLLEINFMKFNDYLNEYLSIYSAILGVLFVRTILNYFVGREKIYSYKLMK